VNGGACMPIEEPVGFGCVILNRQIRRIKRRTRLKQHISRTRQRCQLKSIVAAAARTG
jgi:hypothetical protein